MKKLGQNGFWKRLVASFLAVIMILTAAEWDNIAQLLAADSEIADGHADYNRLNYWFDITIPLSGYADLYVGGSENEKAAFLSELQSGLEVKTQAISGSEQSYKHNTMVGDRTVSVTISEDGSTCVIHNIPVWVQSGTQTSDDGTGTYTIPAGFYTVTFPNSVFGYELSNTSQSVSVVMDSVNKKWSGRCAQTVGITMEQNYEQLNYVFNLTIPFSGCPGTATASGSYLQALRDITITTKPINSTKAFSYKTYHIGDKVGDKSIGVTVSGNTCTITNIPVWIDAGTGDQTQGGSGDFTTPSGFYTVNVPGKVHIYNVSNNSQSFKPVMDNNERKWSCSCQTMTFSKQTDLQSKEVPVTWLTRDVDGVEAYRTAWQNNSSAFETSYLYSTATEQFYLQNSHGRTLLADENNGNKWKIQFYDLVKEKYENNKYSVSIIKPEGYNLYINGELQKGNYRYFNSALLGLTSIEYREQTKVSGLLEWHDDECSEDRPDVSAVESNLAVYLNGVAVDTSLYQIAWRDKNGNLWSDESTEFDNDSDTWSYEITGLDKFDEDMNLLHYSVKIRQEEISADSKDLIPSLDTSLYYYHITYDNKDNSTDSTLAYDNATIHAALYNVTRTFAVDVNWMDDATGVNAQPGENAKYDSAMDARAVVGSNEQIHLYLWRETDGSNGAAAVCDESGKQYVCTLTYDGAENPDAQVIDFSSFGIENEKQMPIYDEMGKKYTYYFTMDIGDESEYKAVYPNAGVKKVFSGDVISLVRAKQINVSAQKIWKASGQNDYKQNEVTLELQHRSEAGEWEMAAYKTVGTASAAKTVLEHVFAGVEQYDENGKVYEFRVIEPSVGTVSILWHQGLTSEDGQSSINYKIGNNSYVAELGLSEPNSADGSYAGGSYTVTNRLTGTLNYNIEVTWPDSTQIGDVTESGSAAYLEALEVETSDSPSAAYIIRQNGTECAKVTLEKNDTGLSAQVSYKKDGVYQEPVTDSIIVSSGKDSEETHWTQWKISGIMLPEYDSEGNCYVYTISESECSVENTVQNEYNNGNTNRVCWEEISYSNNTAQSTETAVVSHHLSSGSGGATISVEKKWVDNITTYTDRSVEVHVVLLQREKGSTESYTVAKDLALDGDSDGSKEKYKITLNADNGFKRSIGVKALSDDTTLDTENYEYAYGVIEYAVTVGDRSYTDSYRVDIARSGNSFTITNTIEQKVHLYLDTTWDDASNISGYRSKVYVAELYQEGIAEPVATKILLSDEMMTGDTYDNVYHIDFGEHELYTDGNRNSFTVKQYIADKPEGVSDEEIKAYTDRSLLVNCRQITTYDTPLTTKTNYTMSLETGDVTESTTEAGKFIYTQTFRILNQAQNVNYGTEFYVLWHDETAFNDGARPDMEYELYARLGDGEIAKYTGEYTAVTLSADEQYPQNPYFQKIQITGLEEFREVDGQMVKYQYFLKPTVKSVPQYAFNTVLYDSIKDPDDSSKLLLVDAPKTVDGKVYSQKVIDSRVGTVTTYIPEYGAVSATLTGTVKNSGTKTWSNLKAGMPASSYPYCEIYLYMSSYYDTTYDINKTEGILGEHSVATTSLDEASGFKNYYFYEAGTTTERSFPKYDAYGCVYSFAIKEGIYTKNDGTRTVVNEHIIVGEQTNGINLINKFDPDQSNKRTITVSKYWDKAVANYYPTAKFTLYRMEWQDAWCASGNANGLDADEIDYRKIPDDINESYLKEEAAKPEAEAKVTKIQDFAIGYNNGKTNGYGEFSIQGLSIYSPAGAPYVYFIVENKEFVPSYEVHAVESAFDFSEGTALSNLSSLTTLASRKASENFSCETTAISSNVILVGNDGTDFATGEGETKTQSISHVAFENEYQTKTFLTLTGTVTWEQGQYNIGTTPEFSAGAGKTPEDYFNVIVVRSASKQSGYENTDNEIVYSTSATDDKKIVVTWEEAESKDSHTQADLKNKWKYSIRLASEEFLQCSENGNYYDYKVYCFFKNGSDGGSYLTLEQKTDSEPGTFASANYTRNASYVVSAKYVDANKVLDVKNVNYTLKGTLSVMKVWKDGYDSYGLRPTEVTVAVQYKDQASDIWKNVKKKVWNGTQYVEEDVIFTLTKSGGWKNNTSFIKYPIASLSGSDLAYYSYRVVEIKLGSAGTNEINTYVKRNETTGDFEYPVEEYQTQEQYEEEKGSDASAISTYGYRSKSKVGSYYVYQPEEVSTSASSANLSCTVYNVMENTTTTTLTITKTWDEPGNAIAVRPNVRFLVQKRAYSADNSGIWETLLNDNGTPYIWTMTGKATESQWSLTLKNLPMYTMADDGTLTTMEYRAIEVGNTYASDGTVTTDVPIVRTVTVSGSTINYSGGSAIANYDTTDVNYRASYDADTLPYVGSYVLTAYANDRTETGNGTGVFTYTTEFTDTMLYKEVSAQKNWVVGDGMDGVTADIVISSGESYYTVSTDELGQQVYTYLEKSASWTSTYSGGAKMETVTWQVPVYTDRHEPTKWTVSEEKVLDGKVAYTGDSAIGIATSENDQDWMVTIKAPVSGDGTGTWQIWNTPLTSHKLEVSYEKDNTFATTTRAVDSAIALQYRFAGGAENSWVTVSENSDFYKNLPEDAVFEEKIANSEKSPTYEAEFTMLPLYDAFGNKYEYRVIETGEKYEASGAYTAVNYVPAGSQTNGSCTDALLVYKLNDASGASEGNDAVDREVGGYTFVYDHSVSGVTKLTKTLLTTNLSGEKVWEDADDKNGTRAAFTTASDDSSSTYMRNTDSTVKVVVKKLLSNGKAVEVKDISNQPISNAAVWYLDGTDGSKWHYTTAVDPANGYSNRTEGLLLKYEAGTDALVQYVVSEAYSNQQYTTEYKYAATGEAFVKIAGTEPDGTNPDMFDTKLYTITNKLNVIDKLTVKKSWNDIKYDETSWILKDGKLGYKPLSVTVKLQRSVDGSTFTDVTGVQGMTPIVLTAELDSMNENLTELVISEASFSELPSCDSAGKSYTYRFVETEVKVVFQNAPGQFDKNQTAFVKTLQPKTDVLSSLTKAADGTYTYEIGSYQCSLKKMTDGATGEKVYEISNTPLYATANASVSWKEYKKGESTVDSKLKEDFRPTGVTLKLQQQSTTADDTLTPTATPVVGVGYEGGADGQAGIRLSGEQTYALLGDTTEAPGSYKLPIVGLDDGQNLVIYAYRMVEEEFSYQYSADYAGLASEALKYYAGENASSGEVPSTASPWSKAFATSAFYTGTNSTTEKKDASSYVYAYKTVITNSLNLTEVSGVTCTLSGTITWKDKYNAPGYRPADLTLAVEGYAGEQKRTAINAAEIGWAYDGSDNDPSKGNEWRYQVSVPIYSANGEYLTYTVTQTTPEHYNTAATAVKGDGTHVTMHEVSGSFERYYKQSIVNMDFTEEAEAKLYVVKEWQKPTDSSEIAVKPDDLEMKIQYRKVTRRDDGSVDTVVSDWTVLPEDMLDAVFEELLTADKLLSMNKYSAGNAGLLADTVTDSVNGITTEQWMTVFSGLPLFDEAENWYEYRVLEKAVKKNEGGTTQTVFLGSDSSEMVDLSGYISTGANVEELDAAAHVGGYLLTGFEHNTIGQASGVMNNADSQYSVPKASNTPQDPVGQYGDSISFLTNSLDVRKAVTVEKKWNVNDPSVYRDDASGSVKVQLFCIRDGQEISLDEGTTQVTLNKANNWTYTWTNLPRYDANAKLIEWTVRELAVNGVAVDNTNVTNGQNEADLDINNVSTFTGLSEDHKWSVSYECSEGVVDADDRRVTSYIYTISNTPLTEHKLHVEYDADFINAYGTRSEKTTAILQYRYQIPAEEAGEPSEYTDWTNVDAGDAKIYPLLLKKKTGEADVFIYEENGAVLLLENNSKEASYEALMDCLPKNWIEGNVYYPLEYRFLVTSEEFEDSVALSVAYDAANGGTAAASDAILVEKVGAVYGVSTFAEDRAVAGYTYSYADAPSGNPSDLTTTYLSKSLLTNTITGTKVWEDENNKFNLRPALSDASGYVDGTTQVENADANIQVAVYRIGADGTFRTDSDALTSIDSSFEVLWKTNGDKWQYTTSAVPRYRACSNSLAGYAAVETLSDDHYQASYDSGEWACVSGYEATGITKLSDITNTLRTTKVFGQKIWDTSSITNYGEALGLSIISSTLALQRKESGVWKTLDTHTFTASEANRYAPNTDASDWAPYEFADVPVLLTGEAYRIVESEVVVHFAKDASDVNVTYSYDITAATTADPENDLGCFTLSYVDADENLCATGDNANGYRMAVKNTPALCTLTGTIEWIDGNNTLEVRPSVEEMMTSLKLVSKIGTNEMRISFSQLEAITWSGTEAGSNVWTYTIQGIPKVDGDGNPYVYTVTQDAFDSSDLPIDDGIIHIHPVNDETQAAETKETVYRGDHPSASGTEVANGFTGFRFVETLRHDAMIRAAVENVTTDPYTGKESDKGWGGYVKMESGVINPTGEFVPDTATPPQGGNEPESGEGDAGGDNTGGDSAGGDNSGGDNYEDVISDMSEKSDKVEIEDVMAEPRQAVRATWIAAHQPGYDWKYIQKISIHYLVFENNDFVWYTFMDLAIDLSDSDGDGIIDTAEPVYDAERNPWGLDAPVEDNEPVMFSNMRAALPGGMDPGTATVKDIFGSFSLSFNNATNVVTLILNSAGTTQLPIAVQVDVEFVTTKVPSVNPPDPGTSDDPGVSGDSGEKQDENAGSKPGQEENPEGSDSNPTDSSDGDGESDDTDDSGNTGGSGDADSTEAVDHTEATADDDNTDDSDVKSADDVKTSDDNNLEGWLVLLAVGIILMTISGRKRKRSVK